MEGNQMKMREGLEFAERQLLDATESNEYGNDVVYLVGCMRTVAAACRAALSAPARNCDMPYKDRVEMYGAFKDWCKAKGHRMEPMLAYDAFEWLLAPAAERKGEGDGK